MTSTTYAGYPFYQSLNDIGDRLLRDPDPLRRAFGDHLKKCAIALQAVEWVDSGDFGKGEDVQPMMWVLGENAKALAMGKLNEEATNLLKKLETFLTITSKQ